MEAHDRILEWRFALPRAHTGVVLGNGVPKLMVWGEARLVIIADQPRCFVSPIRSCDRCTSQEMSPPSERHLQARRMTRTHLGAGQRRRSA